LAAKARILAIDDQLYFRSFIEGLLSEEGYQVVTTDSGPSALELLEHEGPFDMVITDLVMPGMDGVETVSRILESWPDQEVIVVSGVGDVRAAVAAMKIGAADYLLKPIDRDGLVRAIETVLERGRMRDENARLVDENLAFMGLVSMFERAVPLFGIRTPEEVGQTLLRLLCEEVRAPGATLWVPDESRGGYLRSATHGELPAEATAPPHCDGERFARAVRSGWPEVSAATEGAEGGGQVLIVPCLDDETPVAVVEVCGGTPEPLKEPQLAACAKLARVGAMALRNAVDVAGMRVSALRDPATGLPTRAFLADVAQIEIRKAQRFGRLMSLAAIQLDPRSEATGEATEEASNSEADALAQAHRIIESSIRGTDLLASEGRRMFWLLLTDSSPLGSLVLKRRIAEGLEQLVEETGLDAIVALGIATFPSDGDSFQRLVEVAAQRAGEERKSLIHALDVNAETPLAEFGSQLLARAERLPADFVTDAANLLMSELSVRPADRGFLFLAPGSALASMVGALSALGETDLGTDVFVATDGETMPSGAALNALPLPAGVSASSTWIIRFGEAPAYAMLAGPVSGDGTRQVFHSADPVLVEHLALRLRTEVGLGVRS
jgi:DNA-binding response OmpR family regulator/GGDEF domain-containing protein